MRPMFEFIKVRKPSKIIGLAIAYKKSYPNGDYPEEPLLFLKANNAFITHGENIVYPDNVESVWVENELAIIVSKKCKNVRPENAQDYILGYTIGNDITARNICNRDVHLARSKSLDTFCPVGPHIVNGIDTSDLYMKTWINDKLVQDAKTSDRIYTDYEVLSIVSRLITLEKGDVLLTGTHPGKIAELYLASVQIDCIIKPGDHVKMEIENIGTLENKVI